MQLTIGRVACIALLFLLLLTAIPVKATNNELPSGSSIDLSFSPSRIPLGYSSTLDISVGAEHVGTDLYVLVDVNFPDWLRWKTSDIKMGNFLYGGVVYKSNNQNLGANFLQIAVVVPKGDYKDVLIPVTPNRAGIFALNEVTVVTLPVVNGNYVFAQDGYTIQGLTISTLQFTSRLEVYDPLLSKVLDNQQQIFTNQERMAGLIQNGFSALSIALQSGFGSISSQNEELLVALTNQNIALQNQIDAKFAFLSNGLFILLGLAAVILVYLFWFTYRLSKNTR